MIWIGHACSKQSFDLLETATKFISKPPPTLFAKTKKELEGHMPCWMLNQRCGTQRSLINTFPLTQYHSSLHTRVHTVVIFSALTVCPVEEMLDSKGVSNEKDFIAFPRFMSDYLSILKHGLPLVVCVCSLINTRWLSTKINISLKPPPLITNPYLQPLPLHDSINVIWRLSEAAFGFTCAKIKVIPLRFSLFPDLSAKVSCCCCCCWSSFSFYVH